MSHNILVAQGGGPTAVINQSLVGVALEARRFSAIARVYGAVFGVRGIVERRLRRPRPETTATFEAVAATPAAALGSTRDKPDRRLLPGNLQGPERTGSTASSISGATIPPTPCASSPKRRPGRRGHPRHPYPQDHRQRSGRLRPHAGLSLGGALRRPGLRRRQPRLRRAAGRLFRGDHGPPRRLPHRRRRVRASSPATARTSSTCRSAPSSSTSSLPT